MLLAVALYDTNTTILGRRILTATLSDEWNAYNPLNRQQRLTLTLTLTQIREPLRSDRDGIASVLLIMSV